MPGAPVFCLSYTLPSKAGSTEKSSERRTGRRVVGRTERKIERSEKKCGTRRKASKRKKEEKG